MELIFCLVCMDLSTLGEVEVIFGAGSWSCLLDRARCPSVSIVGTRNIWCELIALAHAQKGGQLWQGRRQGLELI
jgi:hypothetical protein